MELTKLTEEEIAVYEEKAAAIAQKLNIKRVIPAVFVDANTNKRYAAYFKEPSYLAKLGALDKSQNIGPFAAGDELMEICLLREESDPEIYSENPDYDVMRLGAVNFCVRELVKVSFNQFKKK